jgi:hypothetical protein
MRAESSEFSSACTRVFGVDRRTHVDANNAILSQRFNNLCIDTSKAEKLASNTRIKFESIGRDQRSAHKVTSRPAIRRNRVCTRRSQCLCLRRLADPQKRVEHVAQALTGFATLSEMEDFRANLKQGSKVQFRWYIHRRLRVHRHRRIGLGKLDDGQIVSTATMSPMPIPGLWAVSQIPRIALLKISL